MSVAPSRWRGRWWLYALAWLPILTIYLTLFFVNGMPLGNAVRGAIANVLPNALLGIGVLRVPRRLPLPEGRRARFFSTHAALLVAFLLASGAGWMALVLLDRALFRGDFRIDVRLLPWRVLIDLLVYCGLLGLGYAWHNAAAGRETLNCIVPSFALQTLVENSIHHAIAPRAAGGRLAVSARQVADRLIVRVEDDGPGGAAPPPGENHGVIVASRAASEQLRRLVR